MKKEKKERKKIQYSKIIITVILIAGILFIQESYVLAYLGRTEIAEELSKYVTKVIIGTILGYFLKSYAETNSEKKSELAEKEFNAKYSINEVEDSVVEEEEEDFDAGFQE